MRAIVLAYHDMGVVGLETLLRHGFDIAAVFTHVDDPGETQWAASVAEEALASLPASICKYVANCPILIEDLPSRELVRSESLSPQILGLFVGVPATEAGAGPSGIVPRDDTDRIVLFKRNLEKVAPDRDELIKQIQITVKHEIGHYLGMDEDDLDHLGLG